MEKSTLGHKGPRRDGMRGDGCSKLFHGTANAQHNRTQTDIMHIHGMWLEDNKEFQQHVVQRYHSRNGVTGQSQMAFISILLLVTQQNGRSVISEMRK